MMDTPKIPRPSPFSSGACSQAVGWYREPCGAAQAQQPWLGRSRAWPQPLPASRGAPPSGPGEARRGGGPCVLRSRPSRGLSGRLRARPAGRQQRSAVRWCPRVTGRTGGAQASLSSPTADPPPRRLVGSPATHFRRGARFRSALSGARGFGLLSVRIL